MGQCFLHGNGGSNPLNFRVLNGTSAPSNPKENTIWVNTGTEITGWEFSPSTPANPTEGMVWIQTGVSGALSFNALKKNAIKLYPLKASQYISGAWESKDTMVYLSGAWVETKRFLFKSGYGSTIVWAEAKESYTSYTIASDAITFSTENGYCTLYSNEQIDLSEYSHLYFELEVGNTLGYKTTVGVASAVNGHNSIGWVANASLVDSERTTLSIDISSINAGYITIQAMSSPTVYNIWAE